MRRATPDGRTSYAWSLARPLGEGTRRHAAVLRSMADARVHGRAFAELLAGDNMESASLSDQDASQVRPLQELLEVR
jgi:hypothetical protein